MSLRDRIRRLWARTEIGEENLAADFQEMAATGRVASQSGVSGLTPDLDYLDDRRGQIERERDDVEQLLGPEAGIQPIAPADTGAQLQKDVDEHADNIAAWKRKDRPEG